MPSTTKGAQVKALSLLLVLLTSAVGVDRAKAAPTVEGPLPIPKAAVEHINAQLRLLVDLATERYIANSNRNEIWILTVHRGTAAKKYTDGRRILLSLPAAEDGDRSVLRAYATTYNSLTLGAADLEVKAKRYVDARETYRLLLRFGCWGKEGLEQEKLEERLALVGKLERGEDTDGNLKKLLSLHAESSSFTDIPAIQLMRPTVVSDLTKLTAP